jgi:CBS domain-containing protein
MSSRVISIGPDEPLSMAAQMFWRHKVHRLLVLEGESLVGIVTPFDLMMAY